MIIETKSVCRLSDPITKVADPIAKSLADMAQANELKRSRVCFHENSESQLQEMQIHVCDGSYIRPAKHLKKRESLLVIEGFAKLILFDDNGTITNKIKLGPYGSARNYFYRLNKPVFHTLALETSDFLFHEVTTGPFVPSETIEASWSPRVENKNDCSAFIQFLKIAEIGDKYEVTS